MDSIRDQVSVFFPFFPGRWLFISTYIVALGTWWKIHENSQPVFRFFPGICVFVCLFFGGGSDCWWKKSCTTWDVKEPCNKWDFNYQPELVSLPDSWLPSRVTEFRRQIIKTGWWFQRVLFSPLPDLGKKNPQFDEHIFQRGWFNHQLVKDLLCAQNMGNIITK